MMLALNACTPAAPPPPVPDTAADVAAINAIREREIVFVAASNADSLSTLYSADIAMMPPGEPGIVGSEALKKWLTDFFAAATMTVKITSSHVDVSGDWAVDRYTGSVTVTPKGGKPMNESMKGIHILKRQPDGTWLIAQDLWNSDAPVPVAPK